MNYEEWIESRSRVDEPEGITESNLNAALFPHQRDLVSWALGRARAAIFADTGLGKTLIQMSWADVVAQRGRVLVLAPLAVAEQTVREARRFGIESAYRREDHGDRITVTNYEMMDRFDASSFVGVVLDESSILKSFTGRTRNALIESFQGTPFRLACTATPAPNDFTELGNHAEFLGVRSRVEMLAEYFVHDGGATQDWRLKGHARSAFWRWVVSWAALVKRPSDLGYSDEGFALPPLTHEELVIGIDHADAREVGRLFLDDARTLTDQRDTRKATRQARVDAIARTIASEPNEPALVWGEYNAECDAITAAVPGAVQVSGSDTPEWKQNVALWFCGLYEEDCECGNLSTQSRAATSIIPTPSIERSESDRAGTPSTEKSTSKRITSARRPTASAPRSNAKSETQNDALSTPQTKIKENEPRPTSSAGKRGTPTSDLLSASENTESHPIASAECSKSNAADAPFAERQSHPTSTTEAARTVGFTSITVTKQDGSEGYCAPRATWVSGSFRTTLPESNVPRCTCGRLTRHRPKILISKTSIFGFGLNFQHCARVYFVGASHSYEQTYQAIRRCWRFGQKREVIVRTCVAETERAVISNLRRKHEDAEEMSRQMLEHVSQAAYATGSGARRQWNDYEPKMTMEVPSWLR